VLIGAWCLYSDWSPDPWSLPRGTIEVMQCSGCAKLEPQLSGVTMLSTEKQPQEWSLKR